MNTLKIVIVCILLMSIGGCDKKVTEDLSNVDVDRYIELLKDGKYDSFTLPEFTPQDIPKLLEYRNDTQTITNFPQNGISSFSIPECSLGMYVLWTIESIRAVSIDSKYLIGRFPSQNSIVQQKEEPFELKFGGEVQEVVSKVYHDWWEINKNKNFDEFNHIDPLSNTEYKWH